jgi:hypothetical protein
MRRAADSENGHRGTLRLAYCTGACLTGVDEEQRVVRGRGRLLNALFDDVRLAKAGLHSGEALLDASALSHSHAGCESGMVVECEREVGVG